MKSNEHSSVLLDESIEGLNIKDGGIYCDMTLGRCGHSEAILEKLKGGLLIGFDQDIEAIQYAKKMLSHDNFILVKDNFVNATKDLEKIGVKKIDGALYDLGVSSPQFDEDYRGFSYRYDTSLDMRMDLDSDLTAEKIVNEYPFEKLFQIFKEYGEDRYAHSIAEHIVKARETKKIETTGELVEIVKKSKPMKELAKKGNPSKQVFQALRIEVNDELNVLRKSLDDILDSLAHGGRVAVITFQSLEDRIVKDAFKRRAVIEGDRFDDFRLPSEIAKPNYRLVNKKVIAPRLEEIARNHRAKSAKLRIIERI
jgi:16S rRNA (cytosine1402-N4)-methyltransferase